MKCPNCGKEIANDSVYCEYCGVQVQNTQVDKATTKERLRSFFYPIAGFSLYSANKTTRPAMANECLSCAIVGCVMCLMLLICFIAVA